MDDLVTLMFVVLVSSIVAGFIGWASAHGEVASECNKLGAFYVRDAVYECKKKEQT